VDNVNGHPETFQSTGSTSVILEPDAHRTQLVAVGFLFDKWGNLLLLLRSKGDPGTGAPVENPGGGVDQFEPIFAALSREIEEECGVPRSEIKVFKTLIGTDELKQIEDGNTALRVIKWACQIDRPFNEIMVRLSPDHQDYAWVVPNTDGKYIPYEGGSLCFSHLPLERQKDALEAFGVIFGPVLK
jgi:8-oxo-dGTP pyrophosphatase MutT (NUDIX family)